MPVYSQLNLVDAILGRLDDDAEGMDHFPWQDLQVTVWAQGGAIRKIRLVCDLGNNHENLLRDLAYEVVTTLLSETTNNDACDVVVRERSGHLKDHGDLVQAGLSVNPWLIVDAEIMDEYT